MSPSRPAPASIANAKSRQWGHRGRIKRQIKMNKWKDRRKTHTKRKTGRKKTTTEDTTELHQTITRFLCRKQSTTHPHGNNSRPQKNPHQRPPPKPPPGTQGTQTTTARVTPWTDIAVIAHPTGHNQLKTNPRARPPPKPPPTGASARQNEERAKATRTTLTGRCTWTKNKCTEHTQQ